MREGGGYNERPASKASNPLAGPCQFAVGGGGVDGQRDRPVVPGFFGSPRALARKASEQCAEIGPLVPLPPLLAAAFVQLLVPAAEA
jgi:hypothetical protein